MSRCVGVVAALFLMSCGGIQKTETVSTPTEIVHTSSVVASPTPQAVAQPDGPGYSCEFENGGIFRITNETEIGQQYTVYTTSFDHQGGALWYETSPTIFPGKTWGLVVPAACRQVDITQQGPGGTPLRGCFAFYDRNLKLIRGGDGAKIDDCRKPPPTPTPSPSPSPTPQCNYNTCPSPTPSPTPKPTPCPSPTPTPKPHKY